MEAFYICQPCSCRFPAKNVFFASLARFASVPPASPRGSLKFTTHSVRKCVGPDDNGQKRSDMAFHPTHRKRPEEEQDGNNSNQCGPANAASHRGIELLPQSDESLLVNVFLPSSFLYGKIRKTISMIISGPAETATVSVELIGNWGYY